MLTHLPVSAGLTLVWRRLARPSTPPSDDASTRRRSPRRGRAAACRRNRSWGCWGKRTITRKYFLCICRLYNLICPYVLIYPHILIYMYGCVLIYLQLLDACARNTKKGTLQSDERAGARVPAQRGDQSARLSGGACGNAHDPRRNFSPVVALVHLL